MNLVFAKLDLNALAARWWMLVVRGVAAIGFGVLAIIWPSSSLLALVFLWGAYALIDGVMGVMLAARAGRAGKRWGWLLFEGLVSIGAALATVVWPAITAVALLVMIALWAIVTGIAEIIAAIELRRVITGEWMLALSGMLSIASGVLLMVYPGAGAMAVVTIIGVYAILFGVLLCALGFRIHRLATNGDDAITTGAPTHA